MADIVFVCVREDVRRAEALAEAFDRAGFSIETEFSDDALDASAAGVLIISAASARSEAFVETAHWVVESGKAVVISLVGTPRTIREPSHIFDLSAWNGDALALVLEPVICAIDRLIIAARAPADEISVDVEDFTPSSRWAEFPPLKLEPKAPAATPKTPRAYLTIDAKPRPPFPIKLRTTLAATLVALIAAGGAYASTQLSRPHMAAPIAQTVSLQSPGAPVVTFESAIAPGVSAERVIYRSEGEIAPVYSPSRAEPPSAERVLRELRHPDAPRHYARIGNAVRTPSFIDGVEAPA